MTKWLFSYALYMQISSPHFINFWARVLQVQFSPKIRRQYPVWFPFSAGKECHQTGYDREYNLVLRVTLVTVHGENWMTLVKVERISNNFGDFTACTKEFTLQTIKLTIGMQKTHVKNSWGKRHRLIFLSWLFSMHNSCY